MNTMTATKTAAKTNDVSAVVGFVFAALIGFGIITLAGHVQAETLHDAAHDVRHATGFPCH